MQENVDMSTTRVEIAYDGEALREGYMDVRELAPALLAVGAMCSQANAILNGDRATVSVAVRSDFKTGSFEIDFEVFQTIVEAVKGLLLTNPIATAKDIAELLGLAGTPTVGLLWLIRYLKGRRIEAVTPVVLPPEAQRLDDRDRVAIKIEGDNNTVVVVRDVLRLYEDPAIKNAAREVLRPLEQPGIEEFQVRRNDAVIDTITKQEIASFETEPIPAAEEILSNYTIPRAAYRIVKPSLERGLTWKVSDGQNKFDAYLKDDSFWQQMETDDDYRFGIGDVVIVDMAVKSFRSEKGAFRTDYAIEKVHEFKHRPRRIQMELGDDMKRDRKN